MPKYGMLKNLAYLILKWPIHWFYNKGGGWFISRLVSFEPLEGT